MAEPIVFTITEAGKQAALNANADSAQLKVNLTQVAVGTAQHLATGLETALTNEVKRGSIVSGDVEVNSNTLRFTSSMTADVITDIYEVGLFTDENVLFAIASSNTIPLFSLHPDITFVIGFGLSLQDVAAGSVTVTTDPNGALAVVIMENHLAAPDPHPQYLNQPRFLQFLELAYPLGHPYWTQNKASPKPLFDAMFGYETHWRRLEGVSLVAVKDGDNYIGQPMITLGQTGMTDLAISQRPHTYPIYTSYLFERYDPSTVVETVWRVMADKTSVNEGAAIRFTVTANNLPDGQILNWTVKEGTLNSDSNDIVMPDKTLSGTVILNNGQAIIDFETTEDENEIEVQKHVRLTVGAPADLSINVPISDAGFNEVALHISESTQNGIDLAEYYKAQAGQYPSSNDTIRFIVDSGVDVIGADAQTPAMFTGANWPQGATSIIENRGRIIGRGGKGGRSARALGSIGRNPSAFVILPVDVKPATKGQDGGTAIKGSIQVENYGLIAGGGGGGGGMGAWIVGGDQSTQTFGGGGGTGGGAPFGKRSMNEGTWQQYNVDPDATLPRYTLPQGYALLNYCSISMRTNLTQIQRLGQFNIQSTYTVSANKTREVLVPFDLVSRTSIYDDFDGFYFTQYAEGLDFNIRMDTAQLKMSENASLEVGGSGGYGAGENQFDIYASAQFNRDLSVNHGGSGGDIGENGKAGVINRFYTQVFDPDVTSPDVTQESLFHYSENEIGGLAGFVKEGDVTITNLTGGLTKGR